MPKIENSSLTAELQVRPDNPASSLSPQIDTSEHHTLRRAPFLSQTPSHFSLSPDQSSTPSQRLPHLPSHLTRGHSSFAVQPSATAFGDVAHNHYQVMPMYGHKVKVT